MNVKAILVLTNRSAQECFTSGSAVVSDRQLDHSIVHFTPGLDPDQEPDPFPHQIDRGWDPIRVDPDPGLGETAWVVRPGL